MAATESRHFPWSECPWGGLELQWRQGKGGQPAGCAWLSVSPHYCPFPVPLKWPFRMNLTQTTNALPFKRLFLNIITCSPSWPHSATKRPCTQWGQGTSVPHIPVILSAYSFPASQRSFICVLQSDLALNCLLNQPITAKKPIQGSPYHQCPLSLPKFLSSVLLWAQAPHSDTPGPSSMATFLSSSSPAFGWPSHISLIFMYMLFFQSLPTTTRASPPLSTAAAAAAAKSLQSCPTLCDPIDGSPPSLGNHRQVPPSLGFSRQEHWSGLPLPSLSSTTTQPLRLRAKVTSSGEKFPKSQAK